MKIAFGGGCHWCTEAVFMALNGVSLVEQGWVSSVGAHNTFSEAVIVHFNPEDIPLEVLVEIHLRTHKSTSNHSMRKKYRSAIYTFNEGNNKPIETILHQLQSQFEDPIITLVLPFSEFKPSEEQFQNYYRKNPEKPFCKTYIQPKLRLLIEKYRKWTR